MTAKDRKQRPVYSGVLTYTAMKRCRLNTL
jgi:hypothetical protein